MVFDVQKSLSKIAEISPSEIYLDSRYKWREYNRGSFTLSGTGSSESLEAISEKINASEILNQQQLGEIVSEQTGHFSGIFETEHFICAFVDIVRSYPICYCVKDGVLKVSNSARMLKRECETDEVDRTSLLEFCMAGYVTGKETIYKGLYQLQAGELLFWDKQERELRLERYFKYYPTSSANSSESEYVEQLEDVIDRVFHRVVETAAGAPIWVPLSGGLDSRLIICKLASLGCDNLHTFSYGPKGNYEAKAAKIVAETIGVPWVFVKPRRSRARELFNAPERKEYWNYADGLCSMPVMNEYESLHFLRKSGQLPDDAILINGQTGDFISGGHIPPNLITGGCTASQLLDAIIYKHFSIWQHLKTEKNLSTIEDKILCVLGIDRDIEMTKEEIAACFEQWEWQERQAKMVVNGQRLYDFLGLKWQLPLWDAELVKFWKIVPLKLRLRQSLYVRYLEKFNYRSLFEGYRSEARRWPGPVGAVLPWIGRFGRLLGVDLAETQKYASYWGHYGDQYALYGLRYFFRNISNATVPPAGRGCWALGTKMWLTENGLDMKVKL
mgnify:CR=1 FL=1